MGLEFAQNGALVASLETTALSAPPLRRTVGTAEGSRCREVFIDMEVVTGEPARLAKDCGELQRDPFGSIAHAVNPALETATGLLGAMSPPPTHDIHLGKGGCVVRFHFARRLRGAQTDLPPLARAFGFPGPGLDGADH